MPSKAYRHEAANCLADIIDNAGRIERYLAGMNRAAFEADSLARDAVERCVGRVCEAVHRLGDRAEALMPGHPWAFIRGTANRLRHADDNIDINVIWAAARDEVPGLAADAQRALETLQAERRAVS